LGAVLPNLLLRRYLIYYSGASAVVTSGAASAVLAASADVLRPNFKIDESRYDIKKRLDHTSMKRMKQEGV